MTNEQFEAAVKAFTELENGISKDEIRILVDGHYYEGKIVIPHSPQGIVYVSEKDDSEKIGSCALIERISVVEGM